ncbi:MAG: flagellar hook-length control protein FliK [Pyrinomonas methylaliphatogenes]|nr:flagellar hook-length control protein FliK [Pyrinomonas methylaliphatogenes]
MMIENNFALPTAADDRAAMETPLTDQACALWAALFAALQTDTPPSNPNQNPESADAPAKEKDAGDEASPPASAPPVLYLLQQPAPLKDGAPPVVHDEDLSVPTLRSGPARSSPLFETSSGPLAASDAIRNGPPASQIKGETPENASLSSGRQPNPTVSEPARLAAEEGAEKAQDGTVKRTGVADKTDAPERAISLTADAFPSNQPADRSNEEAARALSLNAQSLDRSAQPSELRARVHPNIFLTQERSANQSALTDSAFTSEPHPPQDRRSGAPTEEAKQARAPITISQIKAMLAATAEATSHAFERSAKLASSSEAQQQGFASHESPDEQRASFENSGPALADRRIDASDLTGRGSVKEINPGQQIAAQIVAAARETIQTRPRSLEIQLHPAELGRVHAVLQRDEEGRLSATLTVETESAHHALNSGVEELRHALEQAGINTDRIEVVMSAPSYSSPEQQQPKEERRSTDYFYRKDSLSPEKTESSNATTDDRLISLRA